MSETIPTDEQKLNDLTIVSTTTGLRVLAYDAQGEPFGVEPAAFAEAPSEGVALSSAAPLALASAASPGVAPTASRADHRHAYPTPAQIGAAPTVHVHAMSEITGLDTALSGKAAATHTHGMSAINGLAAALDGKADASHTHGMGDISGLGTALDGKQAVSAKGAANGYAPLDGTGKVPLANLPNTAAGVSNVENGTADKQQVQWNAAAQKYQPFTPAKMTDYRVPTVVRNSATVLSFLEYNGRKIALTGNAPMTLAASEIGVSPDQGMDFLIYNDHTSVNTITFGAGIEVNADPPGTGTAGAVKVASKGAIGVSMIPIGNRIVALCRGKIV